MPVKKPIRRKKSTPTSTFAWPKPAAVWTHAVRQFSHLRASIDRSMIAAVVLTLAIVGALLLAGYRTMPPASAARADEPQATAAVNERASTPTIVSAADNTRQAEPVRVEPEAHVAPEMVTIAGCLAQDGESFRLKDTSGSDAPKSRSWKTAFLHKGPGSVEVVDGSHRLKLTNHVGERVSVTGTMTDGEMQVRSLRRVASSCSDSKPKLNA